MASGPRKLSNLCPPIEDRASLKLCVRVSYYRGASARRGCVSRKAKTCTDIEIVRAPSPVGPSRGRREGRDGFSGARRRRITARRVEQELYDLRKRESKTEQR